MYAKVNNQEQNDANSQECIFSQDDESSMLDILFNLDSLATEEATDEHIRNFLTYSTIITSSYSNRNSKAFKQALEFFTDIYNTKNNISPIWRTLSAHVIFSMFTSTVPQSGLPLNDRHIKQCIKWAEAVIDSSKTDNLVETKFRVAACKWLAGIYERRGRSQSEKNSKTGSTNSFIQLSLHYYEKIVGIVTTSKGFMYQDISSALLKLVENRKNALSDKSSLNDKETQLLIRNLECVLEFHANVPNDKKTMITLVGPKHMHQELQHIAGKKTDSEVMAEKKQLDSDEPPVFIWDKYERQEAGIKSTYAMAELGKLYATRPKAHGKEPDYERAAFWLDKAHKSMRSYDDDKIISLLKKPEIQKALKEVNRKLTETIEVTYKKLVDLTNCYLTKKDLDQEKGRIFSSLKTILEQSDDNTAKHERIIRFKNELNTIDKEMLCAHRTDAWERYIYNVFSILTVIPAIIRARDSYIKYGTIQFWKSESQNAVACAEENYSKLDDFGKFSN